MKANEAPEKVYFSTIEDGTHYYTEAIPFEREYIEYVSKDAFIDKACKWWEDELSYPSMTLEEIKWYKNKINSFRKDMKGE